MRQRDGGVPGEHFGRYRISGVLGRGDMRRLYVAEQRGVEGFVKVVVLKHVLPHLADTAQFQEMFLNEAKIAAKLDHPNIVTTYELGEADGKYFITMEYLPGEDLAAILDRCRAGEPVPFEIAASIVQQTAKGLHYAHEMWGDAAQPLGLVHGDVNPMNIVITYHGVVKVIDFGVVGDDISHKSIPGVFKGKFAYCAPEQVESQGIDRRTDVFSLGIVLWECLTGARLFNSGTDTRTIDAVRSLRVAPPSEVRPNVPWQLDEIVLRALSRDPEQRYPTAEDMSNALERFLAARADRPSAKSIGQWMESLFGSERAQLKAAIAQGSSTEKSLARLRALDEGTVHDEGSDPGTNRPNVKPRALWSTNLAQGESKTATPLSFRRTSGFVAVVPPAAHAPVLPVPVPDAPSVVKGGTSSRVLLIATAALFIAAAAAAGAFMPRDASPETSPQSLAERPSAPPAASLEIDSQPSGAQVFVDGDPSGLKTPLVMTGLRSGRSVEIRLDLTGHQSVRRRVELKGGETQKLAFVLDAATGMLRLEGLPRKATTYVDDVRTDGRPEFPLPVGVHRVRVESGGSLLFSRTIELDPDGLTVTIRGRKN